MIIELTGIPGSGKSTILESIYTELDSEKYIFDIPKYLLGFQTNVIIFDTFLLLKFYKLKLIDWKLLQKIVKIVSSSNSKLFHKINIIRNSYKKMVINRLLKDVDRIFFVDEGLSHIPFNIFVNEHNELVQTSIEDFLINLQIEHKILLVDADDRVLLDRVIKRGQKGHKRMDFTDESKVKEFMMLSRKVLEILKSHYDYILYENHNKEIDVNSILNELEIK